MVSTNDGAVDHLDLIGQNTAFIQRFKDHLPQTRQRPSAKLPVDARPLAKLFRQISPGSACACNPEHTIQRQSVIRRRAPTASSNSKHERFKERPFGVCHQQSSQSSLSKRQLELDLKPIENPVCQHDLHLREFPPYLGSTWQSKEQKADLGAIFGGRTKSWKSLDYVAGWFMKTADYGTATRAASAFVSTNSICQGPAGADLMAADI